MYERNKSSCSESYPINFCETYLGLKDNKMVRNTLRHKIGSVGRVLYIKIPSVSIESDKKYSTTSYKLNTLTNSKHCITPKLLKIKLQTIKKFNTNLLSNIKKEQNIQKRIRLPEFKYSPLFTRDIAGNVIMYKRYAARNKIKSHSCSLNTGRKISINKNRNDSKNRERNRMPSYVACVGISKIPIHLALLKPILYLKTCDEGIQCEYE